MTDLGQLKEDLVTANRILADHNVVDSFGHVAIRHPDNPARFLMSRAGAGLRRARRPHGIHTRGRGRRPRARQALFGTVHHGAILAARPEVMSVVHNHSPNIVPFSVVKSQCFCAIMHMAAPVGRDVPTGISRQVRRRHQSLGHQYGHGARSRQSLGSRTVALMRGHGCVVVGRSLREAVFTSIYTEINAQMLGKALALGEVTTSATGNRRHTKAAPASRWNAAGKTGAAASAAYIRAPWIPVRVFQNRQVSEPTRLRPAPA